MMDVDRRSFVAGMGLSSLPIPAGAKISIGLPHADIARILETGLGLSAATAGAMASRAERFAGESSTILAGASDGLGVELGHPPIGRGAWLLRGVARSETQLADAVGFACPRAVSQLNAIGVSFRWFSGCSFGAATAHLFRGNKSALFLVTRAAPNAVQPRRLDIVFA